MSARHTLADRQARKRRRDERRAFLATLARRKRRVSDVIPPKEPKPRPKVRKRLARLARMIDAS